MTSFDGPLVVKYLDGKTWEVVRGFTYHVGGKSYVTIPAGFLTDFASMPLGVVFKSPGGKWDKPAVVHDHLYKTASIFLLGAPRPMRITREEADAIFNDAMKAAGVNGFARRVIYAGVRIGGSKAWNEHRANGTKAAL